MRLPGGDGSGCGTPARRAPLHQAEGTAQLREVYGTSAQPVDAALFLLHTEGLIESRQGTGTFVLARRCSPTAPLDQPSPTPAIKRFTSSQRSTLTFFS
ncbi:MULTISPECIES: GntR family transcriptional regulator [unclassified Micromonospora]|uniref:GntR family transcriptional regulator n=1 Tax=unclassified Micromonospora TaxID=2617518 RepID=UPI0036359A9E